MYGDLDLGDVSGDKTETTREMLKSLELSRDGCVYVVNNGIRWSFYVENGKIVYAAHSLDSFERLERHLRSLSRKLPALDSKLRKQLRIMFENPSRDNDYVVASELLSVEYLAIIWLVSEKHLPKPMAIKLVEKIILEVIEAFLSLPNGEFNGIYHEHFLISTYCSLSIDRIIDIVTHRLELWYEFGPTILSPYQCPYLVSQAIAEKYMSTKNVQKLGRLLRGANFCQIGALLGKDPLAIAKQLHPLISNGAILLRAPLSPFDMLPQTYYLMNTEDLDRIDKERNSDQRQLAPLRNVRNFPNEFPNESLKATSKLLNISGETRTLVHVSQSQLRLEHLEEPKGQVSIGSHLYIQRLPIEQDCRDTILRDGSLIRIKASGQMGKSSLLSRILAFAKSNEYQVVHLNFQQADRDIFENLDLFLQWLCASVASELDLEENLGEYWHGVLGSKNKCTKYFQRYLLTSNELPLVLGLDEVDLIFQYPKIATDFFGLLRSWHEKGKNEDIWKKLRLVIVHSKEVYIPLKIHESPFNVGLPIELPEFTYSQLEDLVVRHQLNWFPKQVERLHILTGGHPYLVRQALYQIASGRTDWENLEKLAATEEGIYNDHLRHQLENLKQEPEMMEAFKSLIASDSPLQLDSRVAFKLRNIGLVKFKGNLVIPMCELYYRYFRQSLRIE
ncbi:AAA-like domain-containing protein [Pseudanabaena yagii]|nr:AAA-like domain-containing protein [Pseudanabaena yagii]